jgi:stage II sporulation protein P
MTIMGVVAVAERAFGYSAPVATTAVASTTVLSTTESATEATTKATEPTTETKQVSTKAVEATTSSGKNYPVIETQFGQDGTTYKNFSVKNSTDFDLDIEKELKKDLGFTIDNNHQVQVLIFHTHACESYLDDDTGYYSSDYYPRSTDDNRNVTAVGDKIAEELKKAGIGVVHDKTHHDYPSFNGSYERSYDTISKYMSKYKNIKVVLDIHRDAIGEGGESGKTKPVFKYKGKKAAQIMIMTGYSYEGGGYFPFWEENLRFALKLQQTAETMYPGMTRPLNFGEYTYNLNVCNGSLLIEVGTDVNTFAEVKRTGTMLGKALAKVLQNN